MTSSRSVTRHRLLIATAAVVAAACGSPGPAPAQDEEPNATADATVPGPDSALAASIAAGEQQAFNRMPPGAGRDVVSNACVTCHDTAIIQMQRKSHERWTRSVRRMMDWGATLSTEQEQVVVDYLAENFGPEPGVTP